MPTPTAYCHPTVVDLDEPFASSDQFTDDTDLYADCDPAGLTRRWASAFGRAVHSAPAAGPAECARLAGAKPVDRVDPDTMTAGTATFCVITSRNNVAWLRLDKKGTPFSSETFIFSLKVWAPG